MRFSLRTDLGGRATDMPGLCGLSEQEITKPFVLFLGGNGCGKTTLFKTIRAATGLAGPGLGKLQIGDTHDMPLDIPWTHEGETVDWAKHMAFVLKDRYSWRSGGVLASNLPGVMDPFAMGWKGQKIWLHDGRAIDGEGGLRGSFNLTNMRRQADDRFRSHGQKMAGRLRYAIAWATALFDLKDFYDTPMPKPEDFGYSLQKNELVPRQVYAHLSGQTSGDGHRPTERWLMLDEPETGLDPMVFARSLAALVKAAEIGRLRVFCASHSSLALELKDHPKVQVIDLDDYSGRMSSAAEILRTEAKIEQTAATEKTALKRDYAAALQDRGLSSQQTFTAHEAMAIPYPDAVVAPYGKCSLLKDMRSAKKGEHVDVQGPDAVDEDSDI